MMDEWNRNRTLQADRADFERDSEDREGKRHRDAARKEKLDDALDRALDDTFPASDPVSITQPPASPYDKCGD